MPMLYNVLVGEGIRYQCDATDGLELKCGDEVVLQCGRHRDCGQITGCGPVEPRTFNPQHAEPEAETNGAPQEQRSQQSGCDDNRSRQSGPADEPCEISRIMTPADKGKAHENEGRANSMLLTAQRKVREHNLVMKVLNCHYAFDRSVAIFQFVADGRVDFRDLVRDLSGALHTRVELRQIGVRDESGILGGLGPCGRAFCCATFLHKFESVNVKMAKMQRLSLNPSSVSGGCGRLKCCLRYEVEGYREMFRNMPRNGALCDTPSGPGRVLDCNALTRKVRVRLESGNSRVADFDADEVTSKPRGNKERQ